MPFSIKTCPSLSSSMPFGLKYCHTSRSQVLICIHSILLFILLFSAFWSYFISCILQLYWLFLESLWTIKNTFSDYKSKCAFCETNGNYRKYKEEKKQALLTLHSKDNCYCTSIVQLLCTSFTCFSLLCKTFLIQYFYFICSLFKKTSLFRTWIASSTCFQSHQWQ